MNAYDSKSETASVTGGTGGVNPLDELLPGEQVLLLGNHVGLLVSLARRGVYVTASHASALVVGTLNEQITDARIRSHADAYVMEPNRLGFPGHAFDVVLVDDSLSPTDLRAACRAWANVLRPSGRLVMTGADGAMVCSRALAELTRHFRSVEVDAADWLTDLPLIRGTDLGSTARALIQRIDQASLRAFPSVRRFARRIVVRCGMPRQVAPDGPVSHEWVGSQYTDEDGMPRLPVPTPSYAMSGLDAETAALIRDLHDPSLARWESVAFLDEQPVGQS